MLENQELDEINTDIMSIELEEVEEELEEAKEESNKENEVNRD